MGFTLGTIQINDPVFLAPMSGVSDLPFRRIVKRYGASLVFSEMIASRSMIEESCTTLKMTSNCAEEFPMAVQLAGCDPEIMAEAAKMNVDRGAAIIDINFGCPVKKIVNKMAGSALMKDEELATAIMEAVVKAVDVPVTMKTRLGWDDDNRNAPSLATKAQDVGIQMITIHGRTRTQMYKGNANWDAIKAVRDAISLPLIVNGDILTPEDARNAMDACGANGVMIGRGCQGKPWLLQQTIDYLRDGTLRPDPPLPEIYALILEHYDAILEYYGTRTGVPLARKHLAWYINGYEGAAQMRNVINKIADPARVKQELEAFFTPHIEKEMADEQHRRTA